MSNNVNVALTCYCLVEQYILVPSQKELRTLEKRPEIKLLY